MGQDLPAQHILQAIECEREFSGRNAVTSRLSVHWFVVELHSVLVYFVYFPRFGELPPCMWPLVASAQWGGREWGLAVAARLFIRPLVINHKFYSL